MDFVISMLGLSQTYLRGARVTVMKEGPRRRKIHEEPMMAFIRHRDSLLCFSTPMYLTNKCEDDDTASTSSSCTESSSSSCSTSSVSFADPVVTDVHIRPITTRDEKYDLYYSDAEYRSFRRDFHLSRQGRSRETVVSFSDAVVTGVHSYSRPAEKDLMYYSESDLKRFLDDFVSSLHDNTHCES
jgi:hypothetical protein